MKALMASMESSDVYQWLGQGWFLFKEHDDKRPVPAQLTEDSEVRTIGGASYFLAREKTFPFWPMCGSLNLEGYAIHLERIQRRQYRRTYNRRCLTITIPRKWEVMKEHSAVAITVITPDSTSVVEAAFNPKYYTYTEALRLMTDERWTSVALNQHVIVSGGDEQCQVYYRRKLVGTIKDGCLTPIGAQDARIKRIIKFFEGRVRA